MNLYVWLTFFLHALLFFKSVRSNCANAEFERCIKIAEPLIKQVHLIFPDNMEDIDLMCIIWNNFVDCLNRYTDKCFTQGQRLEFKKEIEKPLESVHKMCTQRPYQIEYLVNAPCMKSTVSKGGRCSPYYSLMLDAVEPPEISETASCCSHQRFKECVTNEIKRQCDRGIKNGPASRLSEEIISNLFSSTARCANYIPNSADCPLPTESIQISSAPSDNYPWTTTQFREKTPKELPSPEISPSKPITTWLPPPNEPSSRPLTPWLTPSKQFESKPVTTWLPSPAPAIGEDSSHVSKPQNKPEMSSIRPRPASYGRASSWSSVDVTEPSQGSAPSSSWPGVKGTPETTEIWSHSPTTWYPAAGSQLSNEVDEPNQLGLVKPNQNKAGSYVRINLILVFAASCVLIQF